MTKRSRTDLWGSSPVRAAFTRKLSSVTIAWLFASTNRILRDEATKALVCLLKDNVDVLIQVLKEFEGVNDPYVYERLFGVAYGCALTTKEESKLKELSRYIFETIFDSDDEIYPHILLRDYARGVIEYTCHLFKDFDLEIEKARPPYRSVLPNDIPTNEQLDAKYELKPSKDKDYHYSQNTILSSMTTEYGRGVCRYGDFGRYTFQSALSSWEVDPDKMSNIAVEWIFSKYGYDVELHGKFDRSAGSGRGRDESHERIGKKYQWIALYEILARVSDNCVMKSAKGWLNEENEPYEGTWEPFVRDIDPSMPLKGITEEDEDNPIDHWWLEEGYRNWDLSDEDWLSHSDDLPNAKNLVNVTDDIDNEWLVLEGYPEWSEPTPLGKEKWKSRHKRMWYHVRSYLVDENDAQKLIDWAIVQDFMGRWMPEASDRYQVFDREYYWSSAFEYFNNYYFGGFECHEIKDKNSEEKICDVTLTSCNYSWEKGSDNSVQGSFNILKPSRFIFENMELKPTEKVAEFSGKDNEIFCCSPSVYEDSKPYLLIRKKPFIDFLERHKLKIVWTILGEKNIIGGNTSDEYLGRLEISGALFLGEDNGVDGKIHTKKG